MANYDANYNPSADPAFDDAPFTGEENAEDHATDVTDAETAALEDSDAERTQLHEQPSKCMQPSRYIQIGITNEGLIQLRSTLYWMTSAKTNEMSAGVPEDGRWTHITRNVSLTVPGLEDVCQSCL
jgi:hypothetical protein